MTQPLNAATACTVKRSRSNKAGVNALTIGITCYGIVNQHTPKFHLMVCRQDVK